MTVHICMIQYYGGSNKLCIPIHCSQIAFPGESVTIDVIATDEYDHETTAFLEIKVHN